MSEKTNQRPLKNYFIIGFIFLLGIGLTLYLCNVYNVYKAAQKEIPVIRGSITEINPSELEHTVVENPNIIVYLCTSNDDNCRSFERKLKKFINKNEIQDELIYLNMTGEDSDEYTRLLNRTYKIKNRLKNKYPAFIAFSDGKIDSILQESATKKLTISKVANFIEMCTAEYEEEILDEETTTDNNLEVTEGE